ncbi:NmrA family protein [Chondromyces crocatus]|uniref:NmrA family protein n=2 Tax=Chondromyces crocatus TaxID=52 RepID=A0A0K1EB50_CHOCO|nr:NmrA family protein [Chondromyces crocatus]
MSGVRVIAGDLDDRTSLEAAVDGVHGVFGVQNYWDGAPGSKLGEAGEVRQGKNLMKAAKDAAVAHFIQSSGGGVTIAPELSVNRGKLAVEEYGRAIGLPLTIVRGVFFMDNFEDPELGFCSGISRGQLLMPWDPDTKLQMIALEDLARFVVMAFDRPQEFIGMRFDLAGDELTMLDIANTLSRVLGFPVEFAGSSASLARIRAQDEDMAELFTAVFKHGFQAAIPQLRALHPGMLTFEDFLRKSGWAERDPGGRYQPDQLGPS